MDYKFLNKVVDQIVSETRVDYDMAEIQFPFFPFLSLLSFPHPSLPLFSSHCKDIYSLNEQETISVWDEYKQIIKGKINQ